MSAQFSTDSDRNEQIREVVTLDESFVAATESPPDTFAGVLLRRIDNDWHENYFVLKEGHLIQAKSKDDIVDGIILWDEPLGQCVVTLNGNTNRLFIGINSDWCYSIIY